MGNTGANRRESEAGLSKLQACPVIGVFNKRGGLFGDLGRWLRDKAWETACDLPFNLARKTPTLSLYRLLRMPELKSTPILATAREI